LIGSNWTSAKAGVLARASLAAASNGTSWTRAKTGEVAHRVRQGGSIASPWLRSTADGVSVRLRALSAEARQFVERQREQAAFLTVRLNAQAKGEVDALKRVAREGRFAPPGWDKISAIAFAFKASATGGEPAGELKAPMEGREAVFQNEKHASRNALIPVEPWRCRLPVVRSDRLADQFLMGAVRRAPTEARRSS
jgi:hypothetical protein